MLKQTEPCLRNFDPEKSQNLLQIFFFVPEIALKTPFIYVPKETYTCLI